MKINIKLKQLGKGESPINLLKKGNIMDIRNIIKVLVISLVLGCAALMSSCTKQEKTAAGALIGAGTGVAIGAATGGAGGAVAGGIIGGVGGGLIGNSMRDDRDYRD